MSDQFPNMDYDADEVINDFKAKIKWPKNEEVTAVVKPKGAGIKAVLAFIITAILGAGIYYMMIPAMNFHDSNMYVFFIILIALFVVLFGILCKANKKVEHKEYVKKKALIPLILVVAIVVVMAIGWLCGATIFRAHSYSKLMDVSQSDFDTDFESIDYNTVPRLDESTALTLADQQLGSLSEYKSQYVVSSSTTMINYNGTPARVAYLEYADFFKWLNNTKDGLPAYMIIDVVSQKVNVVNCVEKFGEGIKYSPTELFNEKLIRHIRFQYPTALLDTPNFEVTDDGHPYWITPALTKKIGLFGGTDVKGIIITDALDGSSEYKSIEDVRENEDLQWIDVVYSNNLLVGQYNYYGELQNGFWNSIIFQNGVNVASSGNGYIAMDDDVWVYTGVTSSKSDSSNFGFILLNQRTKETRYYKNGGAIETSAMESAQDAVQNFGYKATFPILLDIEGNPTYFMSLYGDSNTVKGYALVSLDDKTIVGTGLVDNEKSDVKSLNAAVENYISSLQDKGLISENVDAENYFASDATEDIPSNDTNSNDNTANSDDNSSSTETDKNSVTGTVEDIKSSVNNGNTYYYFEIDGKYYYVSVSDSMDALLVSKGDKITLTLSGNKNGEFIEATAVSRK